MGEVTKEGVTHIPVDVGRQRVPGVEPPIQSEAPVEVGLRDEMTLLVSGGIATAEHVPKAIVCGADGVGVDFALIIALGCAVWADERSPCPVQDRKTDPKWGEQRIVNLMAAWRDQLLEVLGAMGMREVRRLRGETGRAIFYEKEEAAFRSLFPMTATSDAPSLAVEENEPLEGDLRWPQELILATSEQARTGCLPIFHIQHNITRSTLPTTQKGSLAS